MEHVSPVFRERVRYSVQKLSLDDRQPEGQLSFCGLISVMTPLTNLTSAVWLHNINDVVVVIGTDAEQNIEWVDITSWSESSFVDLRIRDELLDLGTIDKTQINMLIENAVIDNFTLQSMEKFEYLADDIIPPTWVFVVAFLILLVVTPAIAYVFIKHVDIR